MRSRTPNSGFTLLELSIVLVIIGLIVGGIVVGQDLIRVAGMRATIKQLDQFQTAVHNFKDKYNCLPGDCQNASDFNLGSNGNGDGTVSTYNDIFGTPAHKYQSSAWIATESVYFWQHLNAANMVTELDTSDFYYPVPAAKLGHGYWVAISAPQTIQNQDGSTTAIAGGGANALEIVQKQGSCGAEYLCPSISPAEAYYFDQKMDDGLPFTGSVVMINSFSYPQQTTSAHVMGEGAAGAGNNNCLVSTTTPYSYNSQNNSVLCLPAFLVDF